MQPQYHNCWWGKIKSFPRVISLQRVARAAWRGSAWVVRQVRRVPRWVWQLLWFIIGLILNYAMQIVYLLKLLLHWKG